jgi:hypothetical protein
MGLRRSSSLAELMGLDGLHRIVSAHLIKGWLSVERVNYLACRRLSRLASAKTACRAWFTLADLVGEGVRNGAANR